MKLIVITGQTGTGKTSYALKLAKKIDSELISADSRQVYKYLDIVTGKDLSKNSKFQEIVVIPAPCLSAGRKAGIYLNGSRIKSGMTKYIIGYYEINGVRLWLYDVVTPDQPFSSHDFVVSAHQVITDIVSRGKTPIVVGGSYLYIKHLLYGIDTEGVSPDWDLRAKLNDKPDAELADMLRSINTSMFDELNDSDRKNPHRLIRKIEIALSQSHPRGVHPATSGETKRFFTPGVAKFIGLKFGDTDKMKQVITQRVGERLEKGAIEETKKILKKGFSKNDPGLNTIGYKQIIEYIQGNISQEAMTEQWITAEVQYAKRQYTFMKKDLHILWTDINNNQST